MTIEQEDLTNMPLLEGFPDFTDPSIVNELSFVTMCIATGRTTNETRVEYMADPANAALVGPLHDLEAWVNEQKALGGNDEDAWFGYLFNSRDSLLDGAYAAYDPEGRITDPDVRDLPGDTFLGAWLWFRFLHERGLLSEIDEGRYVNLWIYYLMVQVFGIEAEGPSTEGLGEW